MPDQELDPGCKKLKAQVTVLGEQAITILCVIQSRQVQGMLGAPRRKVSSVFVSCPCYSRRALFVLSLLHVWKSKQPPQVNKTSDSARFIIYPDSLEFASHLN